MSALNLSNVMDAIANTALSGSVMERVYAWPADSVSAPCLVVGYPTEDIEFDVTFQRGSDRAVFPLYALVGKASERTARDRLSDVITGARGVKDKLDGTLGGVVSTARVTTCKAEEITVAGVSYLSATFEIEVYT